MRIAIVGDRNPDNVTHRATEAAFLKLEVEASWVPTPALHGNVSLLQTYDGALIAPGSPYANRDGALAAIRYARERGLPTLGTCGGFQHMLVEFARNVAGIADPDHAEEHPAARRLVVTPLACSLAGQEHPVRILPGTRAADLYGVRESTEPFFCALGLNPAYLAPLERAGLRFTGFGAEGEARILELPGHPFFMGTLFVPQAGRPRQDPHPLLSGLVTAAAAPTWATSAGLPMPTTHP